MSINNLNTYLNVRDAHLRVVSGNVYAQAMNIGGINIETAHGLQSVSNTGNATSLTLEFANVTTGFVTTANAQIGRDLVVTGNATVSKELTVTSNAIVSSNLNVSDDLIVTNNILASNNLTVTGNLNVTTIRSDSNVVAEYTGPHDRPLRKYPEVKFPLSTSSESPANGATTFTYKSYTVTGNSVYNDATSKISNAFDGEEHVTSWTGLEGDYDSNGDVASGRTANYLQIQLPNAIKLERMKIISDGNYQYANGPRNITLYGSINGSNWVTLKTETDLPLDGGTTNPDPQTAFVHVNTTTKYLYYKLEISKIWISSGGATYARIGEWELYGYEEGSGSLDTTLKSVYNVPATTGTQLEVYYDGRETSSYTGSGTTVTDLAGTQQNGTFNGGFDSTYKAFTFNGTSQNMTTTLANSGTPSAYVHTFAFWTKPVSNLTNANQQAFLQLGTHSANSCSALRIEESTGLFRWFFHTNDIWFSASHIIFGEWNHIVAAYDGGSEITSRRIWVNGHEIHHLGSQTPGALSLSANAPLSIGSQNGGNTYFNGSIANFRLYSKALNADQVKELYDFQKDYFLGSKSQVTLYKGHLGVGVTEPSGQLELAGDERIQEYPPRAITVLNYHTHIEGHGEFEFSSNPSNYTGSTDWDLTKAFENTERAGVGWHGNSTSAPGAYQAVLQYAPAVTSGDGLVESILKDGSVVFGEWVEMHSPYAINVTRLATAPRTNYGNSRGIGKFAILGSNNGIDWEYAGDGAIAPYNPLSSTDAGGYGTYGSETIAHVSTNSNGHYYTHHRLVVTHIMGHRGASGHPNYSSGGSESVNQSYIRFYGTAGPTTLDKGSLSLTRSLDVPRVSRYDVDTETPRPEKLDVEFDTTVNSLPIDISGNGNHGTSKGIYYSAVDKAFGFNGAYNRIDATHTLGTGNLVFSESLWVKFDSPLAHPPGTWDGSNGKFVGLGGVTGSTYNGHMLSVTGDGKLYVDNYDSYCHTPAGTIEVNRWYHIVYARTAGSANSPINNHIYVNGVKIDMSGTQSANQGDLNIQDGVIDSYNANYLHVGGNPNGYFRGKISNYKLYSVCLEPSEVKKLYNLGRTGRSMVISDTAVGIGKAPEAQLDVRGNIKCDVIMPRTIAFSAYASSGNDQSTTGVFPGNATLYNFGNAYDTSTYRFTAPVNGVYHFEWSAFTNQSATTTSRIFLKKNGNNEAQKGNSIERHGNGISINIYLDAGDFITINGSSSYPLYYYAYGGHNHFSGHLVHATQ